MSSSIIRMILASLLSCIAWSAAAQGGYIDAWADTSVPSGSTNVRSSLTMMYMSTFPCPPDSGCILGMTGTHWIKAASGTVVRTKPFTVPNTYRATISNAGAPGQCYFTEGRAVHQYYNPPGGATGPVIIAEEETTSNQACVPAITNTCLPGQTSCDTSPIIIAMGGAYDLTSLAGGVMFDIDADGDAERVSWTREASEVAFLAWDRNGNGRIDSGAELFGNYTPLARGSVAATGWEALSELDDDGDGLVSIDDSGWHQLVLWFDRDHDGVSAPSEVMALHSSAIRAIGTDARIVGRRDAFGNLFRLQGYVLLDHGRRACYDVYLMTSS